MCNECCGDFLWSVEKWVLCRWVFIDDEIGVFVLLLEMESIGCKIANIAMWGVINFHHKFGGPSWIMGHLSDFGGLCGICLFCRTSQQE